MLAGALLALLPLAALHARDDPTQLRLNDLDERLARLERIIGNDSLLHLSQRIDALEAQQREQQGNVEELQHGAAQMGKQQHDLYADLEERLARLEAAASAAPAGPAGGPSPAGAGAPPSAQAAYDQAFDTLKNGDYPGAIGRFEDFMRQYPDSALLDNAEYWIGEAHYVGREYPQALAAFRAVGERWPDSRKAPDALLKLGYTQYELKQYGDARATLGQVQQRYPGSQAAQLAGERLARMTAEAH